MAAASHEFRTESFGVPSEAEGQRLDRYLAARFPGRSRSALQKLIRQGLVTLGGQVVRPSEELRAGDAVEVRFPPAPSGTLVPEAIPLQVLYEDDDLLVLDKPAGMVVHPGAGNEKGTLAHALVARGGALSGIGGPKRPGIVHRLDRGTSGLLIVAKGDLAHLGLTAQFRGRKVEKVYLALVWGRMRAPEGTVEGAIGRDPSERRKMSLRARRGRPAVTHWRVVSDMPGFSLLEVVPETGRTHQIRVHLQSIGHPIVGDDRYGGSGWKGVQDPKRRRSLRGFTRLALHAARLRFHQPRSGAPMRFEAQLPRDFQGLLEALAG